MSDAGDFTHTVNFRRLAGYLLKAGHSSVPNDEAIRTCASEEEALLNWATEALRVCPEGFRHGLEFHMAGE
jgi:hypothetical protein